MVLRNIEIKIIVIFIQAHITQKTTKENPMSLKNTQKIKCPDCGTEGEFTIWQSINTKLNPQAKEDLLSGKLFAYTCPKCKKVHYVNYGLLYHQMEKQLMIYYAISKEDEKEILDTFDKMENGDMLPGMESTDYTCRVVHSQNQLREKAYIFDIGLDDRVVEIMKVMTVAHLSQTNPDLEVGDIFLEIIKGKPERFVIRLKNGVLGNSPFSQKVYDAAKAEYIDSKGDGKRDYIVDMNWAVECLKNK